MTKTKTKKLIKLILIWLLVLAIVSLYIFSLVVPRFTKYTSYYPISKKIFNLNAEEISEIYIQNDMLEGYSYTEKDEIKSVCDALNSAHYRFCIPTLPISKGGYSYALLIYFENGKTTGWLNFDGNGGITINGIYCIFDKATFKFLIDKVPR